MQGLSGERGQRGSALTLAILMMVVLSSAGIGLMLVAGNEARLSQANVRTKQAFYLAEAGQEDGRLSLFTVNGEESFDDDLVAAAGGNGAIDFDPRSVRVTYDGAGNATGLTGYGDDVPLQGLTTFAGGWYAAFLTNDPADAVETDDENDRVIIAGVGVAQGRSFEVVEAIVESNPVISPVPPAVITILGPNPSFDGGTSDDKLYTGNDCDDASLSVPVVGVVGSAAETQAELGVSKPNTYVSGGEVGVDNVDDLDSMLSDDWKDCQFWLDMALDIKTAADLVGNSTTPNSDLGTPGNEKVVYIEGDYEISGSFTGAGLIWVTGDLIFDGTADWYGTVMVVGTGSFLRNGGGSGSTEGALVVANVAGADGIMWTADDCAGPDGVSGNSDDGIDAGTYLNNGGGDHTSQYCLSAINATTPERPYKIVSFLQH
jgi:hypothetical protein